MIPSRKGMAQPYKSCALVPTRHSSMAVVWPLICVYVLLSFSGISNVRPLEFISPYILCFHQFRTVVLRLLGLKTLLYSIKLLMTSQNIYSLPYSPVFAILEIKTNKFKCIFLLKIMINQ